MVKINQATERKQVITLVSEQVAVAVSNSTTEPGAYYMTVIQQDQDGELVGFCSCKGYRFQQRCWHLDELETAVGVEASYALDMVKVLGYESDQE